MRNANGDFCLTCKKFCGDGFRHLDQNPAHRVFESKDKAIAAYKEKRDQQATAEPQHS